MENYILLTQLNDFVFCPLSIYFHNTYGAMEKALYQEKPQIEGTIAHQSIDQSTFSTRSSVITSLEVVTEKYHLIGKIDVYDSRTKELIERKKHIKVVYDGYIFQLYGQYFAMKEMGYEVEKLSLYSYDTNKKIKVKLPNEDSEMLEKFEQQIKLMRNFSIHDYQQSNSLKCQNCIYEPACDRSAVDA